MTLPFTIEKIEDGRIFLKGSAGELIVAASEAPADWKAGMNVPVTLGDTPAPADILNELLKPNDLKTAA